MSYLLEYSGLIAAVTAVLFIVLPTLFAGIKYKTQPISFVARKKLAGRLFTFGLIATGLLLIPNTLNLVIRFQSEETLLGAALYVIGAICITLLYFKFGIKAFSEYLGIIFSIFWVMYFYFV